VLSGQGRESGAAAVSAVRHRTQRLLHPAALGAAAVPAADVRPRGRRGDRALHAAVARAARGAATLSLQPDDHPPLPDRARAEGVRGHGRRPQVGDVQRHRDRLRQERQGSRAHDGRRAEVRARRQALQLHMKPPPVLASSRVYGALALVFADPDRAALPALRRCAGALEAAPGDAARTLAALLGRLRLERWRTAHVTCFGYAISKECPPYETEY